MAALPYIQLYVAEYLADTCHLTTLQHGAYLLLIFNYWQRGKPLSSSNERLASVARMSNADWMLVQPVLAEFFEVTESEWIHPRIEKDLLDVLSKSTKASAAGKASARKRYGIDHRPSNGRSANDEPLRTDTDTEQKKERAKQEQAVSPIPKSNEALRVYEAYPHKVGKGAAVKSIEKALDSLRKRNEPDPEKFLIERIQCWINKRERDRAAGNFVPEYPNPATWFNQCRYDDEANIPKPKRVVHVLTQRELDEQNYRDFGSPPPEEWAPVDAPQGWVPCPN